MALLVTPTIEIIRPAESGLTNPFLCRLADDRNYFVKGRQATTKGLIAEVVAATLGRAFGLPIPPFCITRVSEALLGLDEEARTALGAGWCFASKAEDHLVEIPFSAVSRLNRDFRQRLFLFDYWIKNEDRTRTEHGGNPNLFLRLSDETPVVIDHNLAFDPAFNPDNNRSLHVCASGWFEPSVDLIFPDRIKRDMSAAMQALEGLDRDVPDEWHDAELTHFRDALEQLRRFETNEFWEPLK